jgi:hypothetical protein
MKKSMYFRNPVFHPGMNVTVRRGRKWAPVMGQEVDIVDLENDAVLMSVKVKETLLLPFEEIDPELLKIEHDPACRTKSGLLKELKSTYDGFSEKEEVTVVRFEV